MNKLENQMAADIPAMVFQELEDLLMVNIIKHCRDWKQPIATDAWLMKKMAEIGRLNRENIRIIAEATKLEQTAIENMLEAVAQQVIEEHADEESDGRCRHGTPVQPGFEDV